MIYHHFSGDWGYFPNKQKHTVVTRMPCLPRYFISNINNNLNIILPDKCKRKTLQNQIGHNVSHSIFCCFFGHSFVLCFDFLNLFCRGSYYTQSFVTHIVKQTFELSALSGFPRFLVWEKEMVYRYI